MGKPFFHGFFNNFLTPIHNFKEEKYMKTKKIMAAVLASLCATAAMSTVVSATPVGTEKTEFDSTITVDGSLDGTKLTDAVYGDYESKGWYMVTFTSDDPFAFMYNSDADAVDGGIDEGVDGIVTVVSGISAYIGYKHGDDAIVKGTLPASTLDNLPDDAFVTSYFVDSNQASYGGWKIVSKGNKKITVKAHVEYFGTATLKDKTEDNSSATSDTTSSTTSSTTNDPGATNETSSGTSNTENSGSNSGSNSSDAATTKVESTVSLKDGKLEGDTLTKAIIGDSKNEWKNIEGLTFTSDNPFSVQFDVKAGAIEGDETATTYIMGVSELKKDELPDKAYNTTWTLSKDEVAAMLAGDATGKSLSVKSKDGSDIEVKVTATFKAASGTNGNKPTGIALAVTPVILAGAVVAVASIAKKKK